MKSTDWIAASARQEDRQPRKARCQIMIYVLADYYQDWDCKRQALPVEPFPGRRKTCLYSKTWGEDHKHQQILLLICTINNDNSQSLETGMKAYFCVCEEVVSGSENIRSRSAGGYQLTHSLRCGKVHKSLLWDPAVQKSPDGAVHTDLQVLYLNVGTCMVFEEIHCSCYFCVAFPLKFHLHLTLSTSNHVLVKLSIQNSLGVGIFEEEFTSMTFAARSAESMENTGEMHKLH